MNEERNRKIIEMRQAGYSGIEIAKTFELSRSRIYQILKKIQRDKENKEKYGNLGLLPNGTRNAFLRACLYEGCGYNELIEKIRNSLPVRGIGKKRAEEILKVWEGDGNETAD